jgi:predicted Fe-S protein YdhL (DUF1289 family)
MRCEQMSGYAVRGQGQDRLVWNFAENEEAKMVLRKCRKRGPEVRGRQ